MTATAAVILRPWINPSEGRVEDVLKCDVREKILKAIVFIRHVADKKS